MKISMKAFAVFPGGGGMITFEGKEGDRPLSGNLYSYRAGTAKMSSAFQCLKSWALGLLLR